MSDSPAAPEALMRALPVHNILLQHVEESAHLHSTRTRLAHAPHVKLLHLGRFDARLAAHLDGLVVGGSDAWRGCEGQLERPSAGAVFAAAVTSLIAGRDDRLDRLFGLAEALPETRTGLLSAFGWLEFDRVRDRIAKLLSMPNAFRRLVGIASCAMHRIDPRSVTTVHDAHDDNASRARAWRAVGELGVDSRVAAVGAARSDEAPECRFWAAWTAVLLGDRQSALDALVRVGMTPGPFRLKAFRLGFQCMDLNAARELLGQMAPDPAQRRWLFFGIGLSGDAFYAPWLIDQMADLPNARIAGEAFSLLTGLDLAFLDLDKKPPRGEDSGPNPDPGDPNVEMDEDDGLPWPDAERIGRWWDSNASRFDPGIRHFMGEPLNADNCRRVLKHAFQRQRIIAAQHLCLLEPGTALFNTSAPVPRQQHLIARMS